MKLEEIVKDRVEFKIGFLGGSLTEGYGASETCYRYTSLFTTMLGKRFPNTEFIEINPAVGGTDSSFGLFQMKRELLDKNIDMLFIEYAINDRPLGDCSFGFYESIIRTAKRYNPNIPIVCIFADPYEKGTAVPHIAEGQMKIADYYHIPGVNIGIEYWQKINDYGGDRSFFAIPDGHPSDYGYKVYVDCLMRDVLTADFEFIFPEKPFTGVDYTHPKMYLADEIPHNDDWVVSSRHMGDADLKYLCSDIIGASFELEFEGTVLGLYSRSEKSCGNADIYVDGKLIGKQHFFDRFTVDFDRNGETIMTDSMPNTKHTLKVVISDENDEKSEGHAVRIGAILIA